MNNDALSNLLGGLLSDPAARENIGKVMDMLTANPSPDQPAYENNNPDVLNVPEPVLSPAGDTDNTISNIISAIENMNPTTDNGMNLLSALRPYLRPSRANRMNTVIRLMQISKVAPLFGSDLFMSKSNQKGTIK